MKTFPLFPLLFALCVSIATLTAREVNLVENPGFEAVAGTPPVPEHYTLGGAAFCGLLGSSSDFATNGITFPGKAPEGGTVSQVVRNIDQSKGRWITFRFRGLAEQGFAVSGETLKMKIEFFSKNGSNYLDAASRVLDAEVDTDRKNLTVNGDYHKGGAAVWRSYELEELLPFKEVDAVRLSVSYARGAATTPQHAAFLIDDFSLVQHPNSQTGKIDPATARPANITAKPGADVRNMMHLGGRWYYAPQAGEQTTLPLTVAEDNADRLFYQSSRLINPFLHNMTAWMHPGYLDEQGNVVSTETFVPDNVVIAFKGDGFLTIKARNLPNHPTARFPGFNPCYIREKNRTYRIPLEPVLNPQAVAMDAADRNGALPMGATGLAVNGVVFYNPFDAGMQDATNIMDYCCGHPSPDSRYHYHKYPICVNTAFVDKGDAHSEVIGFAWDGLPIYGPYESAGVMAKDISTNRLNAFNAHYDPERGWHYHVTPGKMPYVIGGYFGKAESSNIDQFPGPPNGRFPGPRPPPRPPL